MVNVCSVEKNISPLIVGKSMRQGGKVKLSVADTHKKYTISLFNRQAVFSGIPTVCKKSKACGFVSPPPTGEHSSFCFF